MRKMPPKSGCLLKDQFENIAAHTQRGIDFLEKCGQFMKERCSIELEYATKLRFTSWKAFVDMLNEINDLAGQHEIIAENLNSAVVGDLTTFIKDINQDRKKHLHEGTKVQANLQSCYTTLEKAKKNYEKSFKEAEKTQENFLKADADLNLSRVEVEKARNLKILKFQQSEDNKTEYANHLQKYNDLQYQHYNELMPNIFSQLQDMDERRILELKKLIALSADIERKVFPIINQCVDGITKAANKIDSKEDSKLVIERYKSGFQSPTDIPFEDLSTMKTGSTGSGSSSESNGPVHNSTVRSDSTVVGTMSGGKIKRRGGIFGFFSANKPNSPEIKDDYSDLPPNQRKKKLQHKIDAISAQIQQETATRDGLMKMKVVYEQNSALGDPQSIEGQLVKTGYKLDSLRQELHKYQAYMSEATNSMTPPNAQKKQHRNSISDDSLSRSASDSSMSNPINNNSRLSTHKVSTLPAQTTAPTAEPEYMNDDDDEEANGGDFEDADSLLVLGTCKALYGFDAQSEGSIPMRDGEIFQVIELDQGDGWTRVRRDNQEEGFVPTSYIECYLYTDV
ncbi:hypothetical protein CHUAL_006138 [Chamberlinius hualienensis]